MATVYSDDGSTYTTGGITYETSTGRAIDTTSGKYLTDIEKPNKTVDNTIKETSSNSNRKSYKKKTLSYPIARRNDSKTDYLKIEIADYEAPGLNLPAFKDQRGIKIGEDYKFEEGVTRITDVVPGGNEGSFALRQGSTAQEFPAKRKLKQIKYEISLPMPRNITDTTGVQYGEASLNPIEAAGLAVGSELIQGNIDNLKNAFGSVMNQGGRALQDSENQRAISAALSGTAIGALGGNVNANQVISRASGQILNPNLELLFQGVGLRVFPFQFQFFPRNSQEGQTVIKILRTLKEEMAPSRTSKAGNNTGVFIRTPSIFQLTYMKGKKKHPHLNSFLPTVLSDMKVNYTASGAHSTFYDGIPTHIRLDLQFKELNPLFKEDYDGVGGVGY